MAAEVILKKLWRNSTHFSHNTVRIPIIIRDPWLYRHVPERHLPAWCCEVPSHMESRRDTGLLPPFRKNNGFSTPSGSVASTV